MLKLCKPTLGKNVIIGKNVRFGENAVVWNFVVIQDNTWIGDRVKIGSFSDIGQNVRIGDDSIIQAHVTISNHCKVGKHVFIGPNTSLLNDKYPLTHTPTPCIIEDEVIMGGGVTVLPAVRIGCRAVVGAASVVTHNVPAETVFYGNPARRSTETTVYGSEEGGTREDYELKRRRWLGLAAGHRRREL